MLMSPLLRDRATVIDFRTEGKEASAGKVIDHKTSINTYIHTSLQGPCTQSAYDGHHKL